MGKWLVKNSKKKESLVQLAYENDVPIFCPAFTDSSAGFGLVVHQAKNPKKHMTIDSVADFRELTDIKIKAGTTGLLMIGAVLLLTLGRYRQFGIVSTPAFVDDKQ
jgi:deoxyhypusine synthase